MRMLIGLFCHIRRSLLTLTDALCMPQLVAQVETHKMRRDFMMSLADRPLPFVHDVVCRQALDLAIIRSEGSSSRLFSPHTRVRVRLPGA